MNSPATALHHHSSISGTFTAPNNPMLKLHLSHLLPMWTMGRRKDLGPMVNPTVTVLGHHSSGQLLIFSLNIWGPYFPCGPHTTKVVLRIKSLHPLTILTLKISFYYGHLKTYLSSLLRNPSCLVGWGCRIHWLHLPTMSVLDMTLNNIMVRSQ